MPGCPRDRWALGYCPAHWSHNRYHGHPTIKKPSICVPCHVVGCGRSARAGIKGPTPVCHRHESVLRRYGEIRATRPAKHDDAALLAAGAKVCTQCHEKRPLDQFIRRKNPRGGASAFVSDCNECRSADKRAGRAAAGAVPRVEMAARARAKAAAKEAEKARARQRREENQRQEQEQARLHGPMCRRCGERKPAEMFWSKGKCKACELAEFKRHVDSVDERYVRRLMAKNSPVLKGSDIPLGLVQVKQLELQIKRYIKTNGGSV